MTKITLGLLIIATCTALLSTGAEAKSLLRGPSSVSGMDLGSGR